MARELARILEAHDIAVEMITRSRPGYVVYEDEFQAVAEPFRSEHPVAAGSYEASSVKPMSKE
jgi:hypothetical protein